MKIFIIEREQYLPISIQEAWDFFSAAGNLKKITPPELRFEILTSVSGTQLFDGMKIKYTLKPLMSIPIGWETLITGVNAPYQFTDKQISGPYALWEHTHTFAAVSGGVKMTDKVRYALPFSWLGLLVHAIAVKKKLVDIFDFRKSALVQLFGVYGQQLSTI